MKKNLLISLKLTAALIFLFGGLYPLLISGIGKVAPGGGSGEKVLVNGKVVGYGNVGQKFTDAKYFWGRPSAVDYNAAGSSGTNKGPSNPDYLAVVQARIDSFLVHNPGIRKEDIPSDLITASGSGLDPNISIGSAQVQVKRIANARKIKEEDVLELINLSTESPWLRMFGPSKVNVLKLNIALDQIKPLQKMKFPSRPMINLK